MNILILMSTFCLAKGVSLAKKNDDFSPIDLFSDSNKPSYLNNDEEIIEGDIIIKKINDELKTKDSRGLLMTSDAWRWPDNTLPYEFDTSYSQFVSFKSTLGKSTSNFIINSKYREKICHRCFSIA